MGNYLINRNNCTGCMACQAICPRKAISQVEVDGFLYPQIDNKRCVDCKMCNIVCKSANTKEKVETKFKPKYYALYNRDTKERTSSSSGGAFSLIAKPFVTDGGVVYGAAFDGQWNVCHIRADSCERLEKIKKSKYVQSNIASCYKQIEDDLKKGKKVLFTGTACQCSGLKSYLKRRQCNYDNLFLVDLICHGVPSPILWKKYIEVKQKKKKAKLIGVNFRDKEISWREFQIKYEYKNGKTETLRQNEDPFLILFFHNLILRKSCHSCNYANTERISDITLGDFWGVWELRPKMFDDKGTSVVMINSDKGEALFDRTSSNAVYECISIDELVKHQNNLKHPSVQNIKSKSLWEVYNRHGIKQVLSKYADDNIFGRIKRKYIYNFLRKIRLWDLITRMRK